MFATIEEFSTISLLEAIVMLHIVMLHAEMDKCSYLKLHKIMADKNSFTINTHGYNEDDTNDTLYRTFADLWAMAV